MAKKVKTRKDCRDMQFRYGVSFFVAAIIVVVCVLATQYDFIDNVISDVYIWTIEALPYVVFGAPLLAYVIIMTIGFIFGLRK